MPTGNSTGRIEHYGSVRIPPTKAHLGSEVNMRDDVRQRLIEVARKGETITYGALMEEFGIPRGDRYHRVGIGDVVGEISNFEYSEGRPRLSAIIVEVGSAKEPCTKGITGGGFFGLDGLPEAVRRGAKHYNRPLTEAERRFLWQEQRAVWSYWRSCKE